MTPCCEALGDKSGIRRFGDSLVPLDEALVQCAVDVSGRPYCVHLGEPEGQEFAYRCDFWTASTSILRPTNGSALASFSRNSQSVVASGMLSSIASPRKRENDSRSRT